MKSIQRSFVLLTLASALFLAVVLGIISVSSVIAKADADASVAMNLTCANEADAINELLEGIEDAVDLECAYMRERASKVSDTGEWLSEAEVLLASIADETPGAVAYFFHPAADEEGFFYAREADGETYHSVEIPDLAGALPGVETGVSGFDVGLDIDALKSGTPIWLEPFEIDETGTRIVCYLKPLVVDGRFRGSVGMGVDFQLIVDQVESINSYKQGYGFLTDADGYVMYHPTIPFGTNLSEDDEEVPAVDAAIADGTTADDVVVYRYHGADKRMAFHLLQNDMRLVLSVDAKEIYADRDRLVNALVISTAFTAVLVAIAATVGSHRMLRPLRRLTEAAEQVAAGDLSVQLPKADVREVSSLVAAYEVTVGDMRRQMAVIDEMAHRDALTGFFNAGAYEETSERLDAWIAAGKEVDFTLAMLDVNNLKSTNDTLGHEAGDLLLRRAACDIEAAFSDAVAGDCDGARGLDIAALSFYRVGGDEFVVLVIGPSVGVDELEVVGDAGVSIACGVAHYVPGEDANTASVRARADALMYEHKRKYAASVR